MCRFFSAAPPDPRPYRAKSKQLFNYTVPRGFAHRKRKPQCSHKPACESQGGPPFHYVPGSYRSKHVIPFIIYGLGERRSWKPLFRREGKNRGRPREGGFASRSHFGGKKQVRCSASPGARSQRRARRRRLQAAETALCGFASCFVKGSGDVGSNRIAAASQQKEQPDVFMRDGREWKREGATALKTRFNAAGTRGEAEYDGIPKLLVPKTAFSGFTTRSSEDIRICIKSSTETLTLEFDCEPPAVQCFSN